MTGRDRLTGFDLSDTQPLNAMDFVAHQLYLQNLGGGLGPLWLTLRPDLKAYWLDQAIATVRKWADGELAKKARRDQMDAEIEAKWQSKQKETP